MNVATFEWPLAELSTTTYNATSTEPLDVNSSFCTDFVCCQYTFPDMHSLLAHFETFHYPPDGHLSRSFTLLDAYSMQPYLDLKWSDVFPTPDSAGIPSASTVSSACASSGHGGGHPPPFDFRHNAEFPVQQLDHVYPPSLKMSGQSVSGDRLEQDKWRLLTPAELLLQHQHPKGSQRTTLDLLPQFSTIHMPTPPTAVPIHRHEDIRRAFNVPHILPIPQSHLAHSYYRQSHYIPDHDIVQHNPPGDMHIHMPTPIRANSPSVGSLRSMTEESYQQVDGEESARFSTSPASLQQTDSPLSLPLPLPRSMSADQPPDDQSLISTAAAPRRGTPYPSSILRSPKRTREARDASSPLPASEGRKLRRRPNTPPNYYHPLHGSSSTVIRSPQSDCDDRDEASPSPMVKVSAATTKKNQKPARKKFNASSFKPGPTSLLEAVIDAGVRGFKVKGRALLASDKGIRQASDKAQKGAMLNCPEHGCIKVYTNPGGLRYHQTKGTCEIDPQKLVRDLAPSKTIKIEEQDD